MAALQNLERAQLAVGNSQSFGSCKRPGVGPSNKPGGGVGTWGDDSYQLTQEDLARALLLMVTNNIGQVAYLNAQLHKTKRIYFVGNFLRENIISQQRLAFAINFWSAGKNEALFLEHEGYFGALGAFLLSQGIVHPTSRTSVRRRSRTHASKSDLYHMHQTEQEGVSNQERMPNRIRSRSMS